MSSAISCELGLDRSRPGTLARGVFETNLQCQHLADPHEPGNAHDQQREDQRKLDRCLTAVVSTMALPAADHQTLPMIESTTASNSSPIFPVPVAQVTTMSAIVAAPSRSNAYSAVD